eukprot:g58841.t1
MTIGKFVPWAWTMFHSTGNSRKCSPAATAPQASRRRSTGSTPMTPCTRGAPAGGFVVTSVTVKYEKERDECLKAARAGYEVLLAVRKIKESDDFAREMFDGRQARERDRVGPAVDEHYRQMGREFLHYKLWAVGRQLELMSAATARAMDRINPVTEARPDWRPAFHQLSGNGESTSSGSRSRSSTAGQPKLRLEHNPDVEPMLNDVYGLPGERAVASARAARRSQASPLLYFFIACPVGTCHSALFCELVFASASVAR